MTVFFYTYTYTFTYHYIADKKKKHYKKSSKHNSTTSTTTQTVPTLFMPLLAPLPRSVTWTHIPYNVRCDDEPVLRYNPYFGKNMCIHVYCYLYIECVFNEYIILILSIQYVCDMLHFIHVVFFIPCICHIHMLITIIYIPYTYTYILLKHVYISYYEIL